jgi:hypothetical protein
VRSGERRDPAVYIAGESLSKGDQGRGISLPLAAVAESAALMRVSVSVARGPYRSDRSRTAYVFASGSRAWADASTIDAPGLTREGVVIMQLLCEAVPVSGCESGVRERERVIIARGPLLSGGSPTSKRAISQVR